VEPPLWTSCRCLGKSGTVRASCTGCCAAYR
jgi:hypothetical protein